MCFHYIPHAEGSNVTGSVSPVELAMRETVFTVYRPALRNVTQTCSVKEMNFKIVYQYLLMIMFY